MFGDPLSLRLSRVDLSEVVTFSWSSILKVAEWCIGRGTGFHIFLIRFLFPLILEEGVMTQMHKFTKLVGGATPIFIKAEIFSIVLIALIEPNYAFPQRHNSVPLEQYNRTT